MMLFLVVVVVARNAVVVAKEIENIKIECMLATYCGSILKQFLLWVLTINRLYKRFFYNLKANENSRWIFGLTNICIITSIGRTDVNYWFLPSISSETKNCDFFTENDSGKASEKKLSFLKVIRGSISCTYVMMNISLLVSSWFYFVRYYYCLRSEKKSSLFKNTECTFQF